MQGGTYHGKFKSTLNGGGTVRSAPGEWATIDGFVTTTLTSSLDAIQTTFTVANSAPLAAMIASGASNGICIDGENIYVTSINGNTLTGLRAASGTLGSLATPHAAGATAIVTGDQLFVSGSNTIYRDFEVMDSSPLRNWQATTESSKGAGVFNVGDSNKFVNLIVHDNVNGFFCGNSSSNTEIYGCLCYNNGMIDGIEGKGHGMYLENGSGYSRIYDNIVLNNFNLGAQAYGVTASYVGGDIEGTVFANAGSPLGAVAGPAQRNINLLVGTDSVRINSILIQNNFFFHPHTSNGTSLNFGYGSGVDGGSLLNNYFVGGRGNQIGITNTTNVTVSGNMCYSTGTGVRYGQADPGSA
jgi:hypothetical protein